MAVSGYCLAHYMTEHGRFQNRDYARPDFKPKAAMVKDQSMLYDDKVVEQMNSAYKGGEDKMNKGKSPWYRLFRPRDANYETRKTPYTGQNPAFSFNPKDGTFPVINNTYEDHRN